jgi:DNA-binding NtrC family response regulator
LTPAGIFPTETIAIEQILGNVFHLIMLDLMMPKLTGLDLLAQIHAVDDDIPVITMTGDQSLETASESIQYGVSAYTSHPLVPAELRKVIARTMMKKGFIARREHELDAAIGRQIRDLREARGLTLRQVAHRTNLLASLLSQIERAGSIASVSSLFRIATALDVRLADLCGEY